MSCQKCSGERIMEVGAKCSDLFVAQLDNRAYEGYVLGDVGIGSGDYVEFDYCLDCGQIQGTFPIQPLPMEQGLVYDRGEWVEET